MPSPFIRSRRAGTGEDIVPPPPGVDTSLPAGANGLVLSDFGTGPGGGLVWRHTQINPALNEIVAVRQAVLQYKMRLALNLAGNRNQWTDPVGACKNYNQTKYHNGVLKWTVAGGATLAQFNALKAMLDDGDAIVWLVDEPNIQEFCGTITPVLLNEMGLFTKSVFPGCLTCVRMSPKTVQVDFGVPPGGYTGIDYWIAQYTAGALTGTPFAVDFANQKAIAISLNTGMIPSLNFTDGGLGGLPHFDAVVDGVVACWDHLNTGSSNGITKGSFTGTDPDGTQYSCGVMPAKTQTGTKFLANPNWIRKFADVVSADADAPFVGGFSPFVGVVNAIFGPKWEWTQFRSALQYYLQKCNARQTFNGLRNPK